MEFRWNDWNREHAAKHGVSREEAEQVVRSPFPHFPRRHKEGSWPAVGRAGGGRVIEVVYIVDPGGALFIIHAMPLTGRRRNKWRR